MPSVSFRQLSSLAQLFAFAPPSCPNPLDTMAAVVVEVDRSFVKALVEQGQWQGPARPCDLSHLGSQKLTSLLQGLPVPKQLEKVAAAFRSRSREARALF